MNNEKFNWKILIPLLPLVTCCVSAIWFAARIETQVLDLQEDAAQLQENVQDFMTRQDAVNRHQNEMIMESLKSS